MNNYAFWTYKKGRISNSLYVLTAFGTWYILPTISFNPGKSRWVVDFCWLCFVVGFEHWTETEEVF